MQAKRYFSKIAGTKFIMPDGFEITFAHGFYDFDPVKFEGERINIPAMNGQVHVASGRDKAAVYFEELEHLVKNNNPLIYDPEHMGGVSQPLPAEIDPSKNAHSEAEVLAREAALARGGNVRMTGEANNGVGGGQPTDVNTSTVDPALQKQLLKPVGPGAAAAAAAKARAQQAQTVQATAKNNVAQ